MCYSVKKNLTRKELIKRFGAKFLKSLPYAPESRVPAFTLPKIPVICTENREQINTLTWGLIPFWVKDNHNAEEIRKKTFNARVETIREKPSFKHIIENQRCMVLTDGYYEWQHIGKNKIPHLIKLKNDIAVPMAGLYDSWTDKENGAILNTFTIITTRANALMEKIHNTKKRMPVILSGDAEKAWIDPDLSTEKALQYLTPLESNKMCATVVEDESDNDNKPDAEQQRLF